MLAFKPLLFRIICSFIISVSSGSAAPTAVDIQLHPQETVQQYCSRIFAFDPCSPEFAPVDIAECNDFSLVEVESMAKAKLERRRIRCADRIQRLRDSEFASDRALGDRLALDTAGVIL